MKFDYFAALERLAALPDDRYALAWEIIDAAARDFLPPLDRSDLVRIALAWAGDETIAFEKENWQTLREATANLSGAKKHGARLLRLLRGVKGHGALVSALAEAVVKMN